MRAIPVFCSDDVVADADSFSSSAGKPRAAVEAWRAAKLPIEARPIVPVTVAELSAAHDPEFVRGVLVGLMPYQAGADAHVNDPFGGVLTAEQMRIRGEIVFHSARGAGADPSPLASADSRRV